MNTGINLTDDQKAKIIGRSQEAQHFIGSPLYNELLDWIKQERERITADIVLDKRGTGEEKLTREQFVERKCAEVLTLENPIVVIKGWASQQEQLTQMLDKVKQDNG